MEVTKSFVVYEVADYNSLMELFDEFKITLRDVKTIDYGITKVYGTGEEHYVRFAEYLHDKYLERITKMRNSLKKINDKTEEIDEL